MSFKATCNDCGYSGGMDELKVHSCYVQQNGGQCEDFPACGHTDGDGCQTRPSHTAEYWEDRTRSLRDAGYSMDEIDVMDSYDY